MKSVNTRQFWISNFKISIILHFCFWKKHFLLTENWIEKKRAKSNDSENGNAKSTDSDNDKKIDSDKQSKADMTKHDIYLNNR